MSMQPTLTTWKNISRFVSKLCFPVLFIGTIIGVVVHGQSAAIAFAIAGLVVHAWFSIDVWVAARAERNSMADVARALLATYVIKVMLGMCVLLFVPLPRDILNGWMLISAILVVSTWLPGSMWTIMHLRILYFDTFDENLKQR